MHATAPARAAQNPATQSGAAPIWTLPFVLVLLVTIAANITMTMMMPLMPIYLKQMGQTTSLAGVAVGVFTFAALLCRPFWGRLLDSWSRKGVLVAGIALTAAMCFGYVWAGGLALLLLVRVVHGIGFAAATNATGTIAADLLPHARRSEGLGYFGVTHAASMALGPALALQIVHRSSLTSAFLTAGALAVGGLLCALALRTPPPARAAAPASAAAAHGAAQGAGRSSSWLEKSALPASVAMALVAFNYAAVMTFVPSYTLSLGLGGMSAFFLVYALTLLATRLLIGRDAEKRGVTRLLVAGVILMAAAFALLAWAQTAPLFIAAAVLFGLGYGTVQPTLVAIINAGCPPARRGAANATFFAAMDVGVGLGAVVWGVVAGAWGYPPIYLLGLPIFVLAAARCLRLK